MPKSRFVSASKLRPIILYCALAFVVLLLADALLAAVAPGRAGRLGVVIAWMVLFPFGGWLVWRRG